MSPLQLVLSAYLKDVCRALYVTLERLNFEIAKILRYDINNTLPPPNYSMFHIVNLFCHGATSNHHDQLHPSSRFRAQGSFEMRARSTPDDCHRRLVEQSVYLLSLAHL